MYLLSKTVDARALTINMNELTKFYQQLRNLTKHIQKLKQNLMNSTDRHLDFMSPVRPAPTHQHLPSPSPPRSRSPNRYLRPRNRFIHFYDKIELGDRCQRADELLADFEDLLQINGDFRSKEENLYSPTASNCRRKIDALHELIHQIKQELGAFLIQDPNNDPVVIVSRTTHSKSDVYQRLDEFQILLKSTIDLADNFSDNSNEWSLIKHRLRSIKNKFQFLLTKTNRQHRQLKINPDKKNMNY